MTYGPCLTCPLWMGKPTQHDLHPGVTFRECRRFPPAPINHPVVWPYAIHPLTAETDGCGEWAGAVVKRGGKGR